MIAALNSALSGVTAASQRVAVAASNIANVRSTAVTGSEAGRDQRDASNAPDAGSPPGPSNTPPGNDAVDPAAPRSEGDVRNPAPQRADQVSVEGGGTRVITRPVEPPTVPSFEPDHPDADANGFVQRANVQIEREFGELILSQRAFEASLTALETADEMLGRLIDIRS